MSRARVLSLTIALVGLLGACAGGPLPGGSTGPGTSSPDTGAPGASSPDTTPPSYGGLDGSIPADDGGQAAGSTSCSGIIACLYAKDCGDNDSCTKACVTLGSATAQKQYQALDSCEDAASTATCSTCGSDTFDVACGTCLDKACQQEHQSCGMTLTCKQAYSCCDSCSDDDDACYNACFARLTGVGMAQLLAAETCWETVVAGNCATSCADQESDACGKCADTACASQFQVCGLLDS